MSENKTNQQPELIDGREYWVKAKYSHDKEYTGIPHDFTIERGGLVSFTDSDLKNLEIIPADQQPRKLGYQEYIDRINKLENEIEEILVREDNLQKELKAKEPDLPSGLVARLKNYLINSLDLEESIREERGVPFDQTVTDEHEMIKELEALSQQPTEPKPETQIYSGSTIECLKNCLDYFEIFSYQVPETWKPLVQRIKELVEYFDENEPEPQLQPDLVERLITHFKQFASDLRSWDEPNAATICGKFAKELEELERVKEEPQLQSSLIDELIEKLDWLLSYTSDPAVNIKFNKEMIDKLKAAKEKAETIVPGSTRSVREWNKVCADLLSKNRALKAENEDLKGKVEARDRIAENHDIAAKRTFQELKAECDRKDDCLRDGLKVLEEKNNQIKELQAENDSLKERLTLTMESLEASARENEKLKAELEEQKQDFKKTSDSGQEKINELVDENRKLKAEQQNFYNRLTKTLDLPVNPEANQEDYIVGNFDLLMRSKAKTKERIETELKEQKERIAQLEGMLDERDRDINKFIREANEMHEKIKDLESKKPNFDGYLVRFYGNDHGIYPSIDEAISAITQNVTDNYVEEIDEEAFATATLYGVKGIPLKLTTKVEVGQ